MKTKTISNRSDGNQTELQLKANVKNRFQEGPALSAL